MTEPVSAADEAVLQRRRFLRGSALLAAAAGGAVAATAGGALPASATPVVPRDRHLRGAAGPGVRHEDRVRRDRRRLALGPHGKKRLRKGAWIDVALVPGDAGLLIALFVNLTRRPPSSAARSW